MIRKLLKLPKLVEYNRDELIQELNYEKYQRKYQTDNCPICGNELYRNSWSEDHWGVVETVVRCGWDAFDETHYTDHTSYGQTDLVAGNFTATYQHNTPWKEIDRIRAEWSLAVIKTKKQWKRNKRMSYRKVKSQRKK